MMAHARLRGGFLQNKMSALQNKCRIKYRKKQVIYRKNAERDRAFAE